MDTIRASKSGEYTWADYVHDSHVLQEVNNLYSTYYDLERQKIASMNSAAEMWGVIANYIRSGKINDPDPWGLEDPNVAKERESDDPALQRQINELRKAASDSQKADL